MSEPFRRSGRHLAADTSLKVATGLAALLVVSVLLIIIVDVVVHGWPKLSFGFLLESPREGMTEGGIFPALIGTVALVLLMTVAVLPVGVATAIYLHEYASAASPITRAIRVAVNNLAGVPSIVFGLFGLGFFVQFVGPAVDNVVFGGERIYGQPTLLWAALTMAVLTLPVVIVATEEALRTIPRDLRAASLAIGATKFQTIFRLVVPQAAPGILTGAILAISRGAGEVAPIMFTGVAYFLPILPDNLSSQFMHLGNHVYTMATQSPNVDATKPLLYATVAVLLALTFALNLTAVVVRSRMRRRISSAR